MAKEPISTGDSLFQQYGNKKIVPATLVLRDFLGLGSDEKPIETKAITTLKAQEKLAGIKVFKLGAGGSKAPYFVDIYQVAEVIDQQAKG
ncbi:MAG: pyocin activator PrtN family protein [Methylobacter sp.]